MATLSVSDHIPTTIAALLREDERLGKAITAEYDTLIALPYGGKHDAQRGEHRENIRKMKSEQALIVAKLVGWWRLTLTTNGHDWQEETTHA